MESELLALIDQLEEFLSAGGRVPLSQRVMVAAPDAFRLLDAMRQALPREIAHARHIYQERERLLQEARTEADATRIAARAEREALIAEHPILREATAVAQALRAETLRECARLRAEADTYALTSLRDLQTQLTQTRQLLDATLKTTAAGIAHLQTQAHAADLPEPASV
ncbi:MAG: hypothetical protein H0X24_08770 [Ktedonobacterales bacterium]|nr:hypothetical protein [Ktedonobacterales bacterium]